MNEPNKKWTEADFLDNDGVLVTDDDVYFTPMALAKRLGLEVGLVRDRVRRKRIPSIGGFVDGERLVPLSLLQKDLAQKKATVSDRIPALPFEDDDLTPDRQDAADLLDKM